MKALHNGHFRGLLTRGDFTRNISRVTSHAEKTGNKSSFFVERVDAHLLAVSPIFHPDSEGNERRRYRLINENSWGNIGVFVTGHVRGTAPTPEDLKIFGEINADNPGTIRGFATPLIMGGSATLFIRQGNPDMFVPEKLESLDSADNLGAAETILKEAGLYCMIARHDGPRLIEGHDQQLFAE